jgi:hypothetical protein
MQRGCVRPATHYVRVAPVIGVAQLKRISDLGIDLVFPLGLRGESLRALVRLDTNVDCVLEQVEFHGRFIESHLSKDRRGVPNL